MANFRTSRLLIEKELCKIERMTHRHVEASLKLLIGPCTMAPGVIKEVFAEINWRRVAAKEMTARMHAINVDLNQRARRDKRRA